MDEIIIRRRLVLRGVLAVGCGLLVPIAFSENASKNDANPSRSTSTGSSPDSEGFAAPTVATKVPQASVQYQAQPKSGQMCGNCMNYIAESNTCKLVDGDISPEGWCTLWSKIV